MKKLTPVLVVDRIEPCLTFWTERLGFEKTAEVPHGDAIGFASLNNGNVEIMYQSRESLRSDIPALADEPPGSPNCLYIEVDSIDHIENRLAGIEPVVPRRHTFYGATEIGVREPGGNLIVFSQQAKPLMDDTEEMLDPSS